VKVNPDLSLPGHPEVFAIGDLALVLQENGRPVPGVTRRDAGSHARGANRMR
jgi:NADH dehydrogenase